MLRNLKILGFKTALSTSRHPLSWLSDACQLHILIPTFIIVQLSLTLLPPDSIPRSNPLATFFVNLPSFSPRDILYPNPDDPIWTAVGILSSPFAVPSMPVSLGKIISRIAQALFLWHHLRCSPTIPPSWSSNTQSKRRILFSIYLLTIIPLLVHILLAFIFTRSFGWVYPPLFRHWSLYEESGGWGPGLVTWTYLMLWNSQNRNIQSENGRYDRDLETSGGINDPEKSE
jgi:hypothetical protein